MEDGPRRVRRFAATELSGGVECARYLALIAAADDLPGVFWRSPIRRSAWWGSLIRAAIDTGLRLGDLLTITRRKSGP